MEHAWEKCQDGKHQISVVNYHFLDGCSKMDAGASW